MVTTEQMGTVLARLQQLEHDQSMLRDLFTRAVGSGAGQGVKLNYREAEKHMPKEYSGKGLAFAEYVFKMEAYLPAVDPNGRGGEIIRVIASAPNDVDEAQLVAMEQTQQREGA